jgi:hypothetical protein
MFLVRTKSPAFNAGTRSRSAAEAFSTKLLSVGPLAAPKGPETSSAVLSPGCRLNVSARSANATRLSSV